MTLPAEVLRSAGITANDVVAWRFEGGELRGAKLTPKAGLPTVCRARLVNRGGVLVFEVLFEIPPEAFAAAVRQEREEQ